MTDPDPAAAEPGPAAAEPNQTARPGLLPLAELYPACFDWERPKPVKIGIHHDLRARHPGVSHPAIRKVLAIYCNRARYLKALKAGLLRWDLEGRPAGLVTLEQGAVARQQLKAGKPTATAKPAATGEPAATAKPDLPANATPVPEENFVPGRLELAVKFSALPGSRPVPGGVEVGVPAGEWTVTAILPAKVWRKLEQAAKDYPQWVAALSGSPARIEGGQIALQHPTVQVFEKKGRPESEPARAEEGAMPTPASGPTPGPPEAKAAEARAPASNPAIVRAAVSRKGRREP